LDLFPYKNDRTDLLGLVEVAKAVGAKLLFVANPDNPSGTWHSAAAIAELIVNLPPECILLLDEAYADFAPASALPPINVADDRVIRLRTFSKAHGLAGARVGYAIASAEIVASFNKIRMHFGVNLVAQAGALASLRDPAFLTGVTKEVEHGRGEYEALATSHGLKTLPSATNFVAIDMGSFERAKSTLDALLKRGVFIRMPGAEPLNRCIRVTVGTEAERSRFAEEFATVL
jgi:histidinol-phosphate aminotransferase